MNVPGKIMKLLISSLFKKPATIKYPSDDRKMSKGFRGKILFNPDNCVGCKLCMRDCPSGAIEIKKIDEKKFEMEIDLAKCIYCGQCADSCLKKAIEVSDEFELASLNSDKLKIFYNAENKKDH